MCVSAHAMERRTRVIGATAGTVHAPARACLGAACAIGAGARSIGGDARSTEAHTRAPFKELRRP
jgi:hypothetical protein